MDLLICRYYAVKYLRYAVLKTNGSFKESLL